jgi:hypothetical protein
MLSALTFWLILPAFTLWAALALWVQLPQMRTAALAVLGIAIALILWQRLSGGWGWTSLALLMALGLGSYFALPPRQNRDWADDVARIVQGRVDGDLVHLTNIRAFRWSTADTASRQDWTTRTIDLATLQGVDVITSVWGNPDIAHVLVSFRFTTGDPLTFSVEIRREKGEKFSPLGGFFRQFELSLIAAEEADILHWRAVPRAEELRLYPLTLTPDQARQIFLRFVDLGNDLNAKPRWYNTVTANCTTVVWQLSRVLSPDLPLSPSLLLSGRLPEYLDRLNVLSGLGTLTDKRQRALISDRARAMPPDADFSDWIRAGRE